MIRVASGEIYRFRELTTLQQWIVERKVSRDDDNAPRRERVRSYVNARSSDMNTAHAWSSGTTR